MKSRLTKISILAISVLVVAKIGAVVYDRCFAEGVTPDRETYPLRGVDVSHHNGVIDFSKVASDRGDVGFIYVKATEGTDFLDRNYIANIEGARRAGIPAGAYHFFRYDTDGELQALNLVNALRGRGLELPPAVDVEDWGNPDGYATALVVERLRAFLTTLEGYGYTPVIYTNTGCYDRLIKGNFDDSPLWIASFSDPPLWDDRENLRWSLWQYSHRGDVDGIPSRCDLNVMNPANPLF